MASIWIPWIREGKWLIAKDMEAAVNGSLERMQTDYIDLYQFHRPQRPVNKFWKMNYSEDMVTQKEAEEEHILTLLQAFDALKKQWKVKFLWLSNETPWGVMKFLEIAEKHNLPKIQTIQNAYSLIQRQYEVWLSEVSMFENVWLLAYSPLAWGILTGKYQDWNMPKGSRYEMWGRERQAQNLNERALAFVDDLQKIADKIWVSVSVISLAWVNSRGFVNSNIIGATTMEQLKEDISSVDVILEQDVLDEIDALFTKNPNPATF